MSVDNSRPHYGEVFATTESGEAVVLTDQVNRFIDELISQLTEAGSGVTYDGGSFASANNGVLDGGSFS